MKYVLLILLIIMSGCARAMVLDDDSLVIMPKEKFTAVNVDTRKKELVKRDKDSVNMSAKTFFMLIDVKEKYDKLIQKQNEGFPEGFFDKEADNESWQE